MAGPEIPNTPEEFAAALARLGVRLPLNLSLEDTGVLVDADGRDVLTVDVNGERLDGEVHAIACLILRAVNERFDTAAFTRRLEKLEETVYATGVSPL
ncbi:hypothetical protein [Chelativorans sp.]|uniref:hypothetical protein n=1 Tax=Chelativorans sp. TaxID=2203393 RepID=UPI0028128BED|nr:hypothetical protein [Chelativorans sp.]